MSYAECFLKSEGQQCTVLRSPTLVTYVSMRHTTRSLQSLAAREACFDGLMLSESNVASGEIFQAGSDKYLVQTVFGDFASGETGFYAVKTNAVITHKIPSKTLDEKKNIIQTWATAHDNVDAFGEIITSQMRQQDPGLLSNTRYLFQVPKNLNVNVLDRMVYNTENYQVVSIDDIGMAGVVKLQLAQDVRP